MCAIRWMGEAYVHAIIIFFVTMGMFAGQNGGANGHGAEGMWDLWCVGTAANVYVVVVALWRISAEVSVGCGLCGSWDYGLCAGGAWVRISPFGSGVECGLGGSI